MNNNIQNPCKLTGVQILGESPSAVLVDYEGDEQWLPLSQVKSITKRPGLHKSEIVASEWILEQKGWA